ncbi:MAG: hypothetical protein AAF628_13995 [Planctomycetota bacterium]
MFCFAPTAAVLAVFAALPVPSDPPSLPAPTPTGEFVLEAGEHNVPDLIDRAAEFLGRNHIYSADDLRNTADLSVRLQSRLVLDRTGCEAVVSELAFARGIAMLPIDEERGIYQWVAMAGPQRTLLSTSGAPISPDELMKRRASRLPVLVSVPLRNLNPTAATNQLRPFFSVGAGANTALTIGATGNSILIQGFAPFAAGAVEMIRALDDAAAKKAEAEAPQSWRDEVEARLEALEKRMHRLEPTAGE